MFDKLDQLFVTALHWLVGFVPETLRPLASSLICIAFVLSVFPLIFSLTTIFERKGLGRIQNRYGPNRVGPFGLFQPVADGVKALIKEDVVPFPTDVNTNDGIPGVHLDSLNSTLASGVIKLVDGGTLNGTVS